MFNGSILGNPSTRGRVQRHMKNFHDPGSARILSILALALTCLAWQSAATEATAPIGFVRSPGLRVPVAVKIADGSYDIWDADEFTGEASVVVQDVRFLPLDLVGHRFVDYSASRAVSGR